MKERKFRRFDILWKQRLGREECPYMFRWALITPLFSVRIHHFLRSDDRRYQHDHPWWFVTWVINGSYIDYSEDGTTDEVKRWHFRFRKATHSHTVIVPKGGVWTIVITGRKIQKWGFKVNGRKMRPLRFFSRYGHPPCSEQ